ncbi:MAG: hypothetical protein AB1668_01470 [Nanoarchaeota archaeon]
MIKQLKLFGSGNEDRRNFFVLSKEYSFFSLFPLFLVNCGFKNIGIYEDYQEEKPDINTFNNRIEHFQNQTYDIDLIYTRNRILLIVRTDPSNQKRLLKGIQKIAKIDG